MLDAVRRIVAEGRPARRHRARADACRRRSACAAPRRSTARSSQARIGYVFDHAAPIGGMVHEAPIQYCIDATFIGRAAHAGIAPEEGRSAIAAAARAIAEMRLGRIDDETTANVGTDRGRQSRATSSPTAARCRPRRARSTQRAALRGVPGDDRRDHARGRRRGCELETTTTHEYEAYRLRRADPVVQLAGRRSTACGFAPRLLRTGGGADSHLFNARGHPVPQPAERHGADPHARRAHRGRRRRRHRPHHAGTCRAARSHRRSIRRRGSARLLGWRPMKIGVVKEIKPDEYRVALTPAGARELVARGHEVVVEHGAGVGLGRSPTPTTSQPARRSRRSTRSGTRSELLLKVKEPLAAEYARSGRASCSSRTCTSRPRPS